MPAIGAGGGDESAGISPTSERRSAESIRPLLDEPWLRPDVYTAADSNGTGSKAGDGAEDLHLSSMEIDFDPSASHVGATAKVSSSRKAASCLA